MGGLGSGGGDDEVKRAFWKMFSLFLLGKLFSLRGRKISSFEKFLKYLRLFKILFEVIQMLEIVKDPNVAVRG